jgi:hypothetical protein
LQQIKDLPDPTLSAEQTEMLVTRMANATGEEKAQWADWLFENSKYYHPTLSLTLSNQSENRKVAYSQTISIKPGEKVTLPTIDIGGNNGIFCRVGDYSR